MYFNASGCSAQYQLQSFNLLIYFRYWVMQILLLSKKSTSCPPFTDSAAQYRKERTSVKKLPFIVVTLEHGGAQHMLGAQWKTLVSGVLVFFLNCFPIATLAYPILPNAALSPPEAAASTLNLPCLFRWLIRKVVLTCPSTFSALHLDSGRSAALSTMLHYLEENRKYS